MTAFAAETVATGDCGEPQHSERGLKCLCYAEAFSFSLHGEGCAFLVCRGVQAAAIRGDLRLARMLHESLESNGPFDPSRPTIAGHSGGACCPCTCPFPEAS